MARNQKRYIRQMPRIYGNLQRQPRSYAGFWYFLKGAGLTAIVLGVLYTIFYGPLFRVKNVEVAGAELTSGDAIAQLVPQDRSIWRVNKSKIVAEALKNPLITAVGVYRGIPNGVKVVIQEQTPEIAWHTGEKLVLLDAEGVAFVSYEKDAIPAADTPAGLRIAAIPHIYDTKALPVQLGEPVAGVTFVEFITDAREKYTEYLPGIEWDRIEITDTTYDVTFIAKSGLRVAMNSLADAGVQVRNLRRLIEQENIALTSTVDLRIDRWAYVR